MQCTGQIIAFDRGVSILLFAVNSGNTGLQNLASRS